MTSRRLDLLSAHGTGGIVAMFIIQKEKKRTLVSSPKSISNTFPPFCNTSITLLCFCFVLALCLAVTQSHSCTKSHLLSHHLCFSSLWWILCVCVFFYPFYFFPPFLTVLTSFPFHLILTPKFNAASLYWLPPVVVQGPDQQSDGERLFSPGCTLTPCKLEKPWPVSQWRHLIKGVNCKFTEPVGGWTNGVRAVSISRPDGVLPQYEAWRFNHVKPFEICIRERVQNFSSGGVSIKNKLVMCFQLVGV